MHILKQQMFGIGEGSGAYLVSHRQIDLAAGQPFGHIAAEPFPHPHLNARTIGPERLIPLTPATTTSCADLLLALCRFRVSGAAALALGHRTSRSATGFVRLQTR